jgi:DNA-binding NarL/FixJ family response regulator
VTVASESLRARQPRRLFAVRIALVEDHALLAQSLRLTLATEGADVQAVELSDAAGVLAACLRHRPHVVLLDLDLGLAVGAGDVLIAPLTAAGIRVVVLTGSTDLARLGGCVEAGAVGLIPKTADLDRLIDQVGLAAAGERLLPPQRRLELLSASRTHRAARQQQLAPFESLTERERDVLALLMRGRPVDDIGHELFVTEATVRTHVRGILLKLQVRSQLAAVACACDAGWEHDTG